MTFPTLQNHSDTLACDLTVFTPDQLEAHIAEAIRLRKAVIGFEHASEGFRIFFDPSTPPDDILAFANDEQRCCAFLSEANVTRETVSGVERIALNIKASPEGASAWVGAFYALGDSRRSQD